MLIPLRLRLVDARAPTDAVLIHSEEVAPLAAALARLDGNVSDVFRVVGGFVLILRDSTGEPLPGLPLRRLGGDFFTTVDAIPQPALLTDELVGLTREQGLILLPQGPVLAFNLASPLTPSAWLKPAAVRRGP